MQSCLYPEMSRDVLYITCMKERFYHWAQNPGVATFSLQRLGACVPQYGHSMVRFHR
ncbi:hypothetical protein BDZ91DRAFT_738093 [Kalaharituber pfeilii]|nr:hypothetical protein BDZ91DRAFT_738093 [Kalaharituber pfeilii]